MYYFLRVLFGQTCCAKTFAAAIKLLFTLLRQYYFIILFRAPQPQSQVIYQAPVLSQDLKSLMNSVSTLKIPSQKNPTTIAKVGRSKQNSVYICSSSNKTSIPPTPLCFKASALLPFWYQYYSTIKMRLDA